MANRDVIPFLICWTIALVFCFSKSVEAQCQPELEIRENKVTARFTIHSETRDGDKLLCSCNGSIDLDNVTWHGPKGVLQPKSENNRVYTRVTDNDNRMSFDAILKGPQCDDFGEYRCEYGGRTANATAMPLPGQCTPTNVTVSASPGVNVTVGDTLTLNCLVIDEHGLSTDYIWLKDGRRIGNESEHSIPEVSAGSQGDYTCVVTNTYGSANDSIAITVTTGSAASSSSPAASSSSPAASSSSPAASSSSPAASSSSPAASSSSLAASSSSSAAPSSSPAASSSSPAASSNSPAASSSSLDISSSSLAASSSSLDISSSSPAVSSSSPAISSSSLDISSSSPAVSSSSLDISSSSPAASSSSLDISSSSPAASSSSLDISSSSPAVSSSSLDISSSSPAASSSSLDISSSSPAVSSSSPAISSSSLDISSSSPAVSSSSLDISSSSPAVSSSSLAVSSTSLDISSSSPAVSSSSPAVSSSSPAVSSSSLDISSSSLTSSPSPLPTVFQTPGVSYDSNKKATIHLEWPSLSSIKELKQIILSYTVNRLWESSQNKRQLNQIPLPPETLRHDFDAEGNAEYCHSLRVDAVPSSDYSASFPCVTTNTIIPTEPLNLTGIPSNNSVKLTWSLPEKPNGQIEQFLVYHQDKEVKRKGYSNNKDLGTDIRGLEPGTEYVFTVTARNSAGESARSVEFRIATLPGGGGGGSEKPSEDSLLVIIIAVVVVVILILLPIIIVALGVVYILYNRNKRFQREVFAFDDRSEDIEMKSKKDGKRYEQKTSNGVGSPSIDCSDIHIETSEGAATLLYITAEGTPPPTVLWSKDSGEFLSSETYRVLNGGSLYIKDTKMADSGKYSVTAANCHGVNNVDVEIEVVKQTTPQGDPLHPPIKAEDFPTCVAKLRANDEEGFNDEYEILDMEDWKMTTHAAKSIANATKNRYINIVPYDHSRVVLDLLDDNAGSDYINASWMDGYKRPKAYIACQGPIPNYLDDFWRMIWQNKVHCIVMTTNLVEGAKTKCHRYWPHSGNQEFGPFKVTLKKEEALADYTVRELIVECPETGSQALHVIQFHFTAWPDHGVPQYATGLLSFRNRVNKHTSLHPTTPTVVHCSAGVGRTGTYIAIDILIQKLEKEGTTDVFNVVRNLRFQRRYMVQTVAQYVFVYNSLLESVMCGETCVSVQTFRQRLEELASLNNNTGKTRYEEEFDKLISTCPSEDDFTCHIAKQSENVEKNRYSTNPPSDDNRVILWTSGGSADYINAAHIDGYCQQKAFIVTQGPLSSTKDDFWKMFWEQKSQVIVMLTALEEDGKEMCVKYWPDEKGQHRQYGRISVMLDSEQTPHADYVSRKLKIWLDDKKDASRSVTQFHFHQWPEGSCPNNASSIVELINDLQRVQRQSGNNPVTVHCSDGVGRTGTFCALLTALDRVKTEQIVDVFRTVKSLRIQRSGMCSNSEQYQFVYKALMEFLVTFDNYANFK